MSNIRYYRKIKRLSQTELGEMVGMSRFTIAAYENKEKSPTVETLVKIASVLSVPIAELLRDEVSNPTKPRLKRKERSAGRKSGWLARLIAL